MRLILDLIESLASTPRSRKDIFRRRRNPPSSDIKGNTELRPDSQRKSHESFRCHRNRPKINIRFCKSKFQGIFNLRESYNYLKIHFYKSEIGRAKMLALSAASRVWRALMESTTQPPMRLHLISFPEESSTPPYQEVQSGIYLRI